MRFFNRFSLLFLTALFSIGATAQISVENPVVLPAQTGQPTAVFMTLKNNGNEKVNLAWVDSSINARLELHGTQQGKMLTVQGIEVPAQGQTELKRGGLHIMVFDIGKNLIIGDHLPLILYFDNGDILHTQATVVDY